MSELKRATILGTGTMGPGMGVVLARAGIQVTLFDVKPEALERAKGMIGVVEGVLDRLEVPVRDGGGVEFSSSLEDALAGCEIVVEAIPEAALFLCQLTRHWCRLSSGCTAMVAVALPPFQIWSLKFVARLLDGEP